MKLKHGTRIGAGFLLFCLLTFGRMFVFCALASVIHESTKFDEFISALEVFRLLPSTIFENTIEGLTWREKEDLLDWGYSENWQIRQNLPDQLTLESTALHTSEAHSVVSLCLYRGRGQVVAAMGTESGPICITELWKFIAESGARPMPTPADPHITDFFRSDTVIPRDVKVSLTFCARPEGLEVYPLFWSPIGLSVVQPDNAVFYVWNGSRFSKRIVPIFPYNPTR